jgi:hypothetical protein
VMRMCVGFVFVDVADHVVHVKVAIVAILELLDNVLFWNRLHNGSDSGEEAGRKRTVDAGRTPRVEAFHDVLMVVNLIVELKFTVAQLYPLCREGGPEDGAPFCAASDRA